MTYTIDAGKSPVELRDQDGNVIETFDEHPTLPNDIAEPIMRDMGVGKPERDALTVLFSRDWNVMESPD